MPKNQEGDAPPAPDGARDPAETRLDGPAAPNATAPTVPPARFVEEPSAVPATRSPEPATADWQPSFVAGDVVADRYRIVRYVAKGGMGEVYEAHDGEIKERVALKTIRAEVAHGSAVERFRREILLARRVTHPNVCRMFDFGRHRRPVAGERDEIIPFLTMELLDGEDLRDRIKRTGRFTPSQALPIARQIASALAAAHDLGIVHRDFKSANVMLVPARAGERAVVTDFGLARVTGEGPVSLEESLTKAGGIMGTFAYMAPEQVEGKAAGPSADLYAFGIVLYEMLTARLPFEADTPIMTAVKRLTEHPASIRGYVADIDPRWEAAILRCLDRDPNGRPKSALEVISIIEGSGATPVSPVAMGATTIGRAEAPTVMSPTHQLPSTVIGSVGGVPIEAVRHPHVARSRRRLAPVAVALVVAILAATAVWRLSQPPRSAAVPATGQRTVAVIGFRNLGDPSQDWLSSALVEQVGAELGGSERLRPLARAEVGRAKLELSIEDAEMLPADVLERLRTNLDADVAVVGSYLALPAEKGGKLTVELRALDTRSAAVIASAKSDGSQADLAAAVTPAARQLRQALGGDGVAPDQAGSVSKALPASADAARLYSDGVERLARYEVKEARELLAAAAAADPGNARVHAAHARALASLGHVKAAHDAAMRAVERAADLRRDERLEFAALGHEIAGEWEQAVAILKGLLVFFPESSEYALRLAGAQTAAGRGQDALATLGALRSRGHTADPRVDLAEAEAHRALTDFERQRAAAAAAGAKADAQGARVLLAEARFLEATALANLAGEGAAAIGRLDEAASRCAEARKLFEATGNQAGAARVENLLGVIAARKGDMAGARNRFEAAAKAFEKFGDRRNAAKSISNLANTEADRGDRAKARRLYNQAVEMSRGIGDAAGAAIYLNNLGATLFEWNDLLGAVAAYEQALAIVQEAGLKHHEATTLQNLGEALHKQHRTAAARTRYEQALALERETKDESALADTLELYALLNIDEGRFPEARQQLMEALTIRRSGGDTEAQVKVLRSLGDVNQRSGDKSGARRFYDEAAALEKAGERR